MTDASAPDYLEEFDNDQAEKEGWAVFSSVGSRDGDYQFQRDDEAAKFKGDDDVWRHIWTEAQGGSVYHQSALIWMHANNRGEYDRVVYFNTVSETIPRDDEHNSLVPEMPSPTFEGTKPSL